jgi:DNA modification methylase
MITTRLIPGDCVEVMKGMEENSVDSIVCDPPYGFRFMGRDFDDLGEGTQQQEWHRRWAEQALRVLKPGGHLLAFGGTRTYHRLACAVEDAGFECRDSLAWVTGSGMPKGQDLGRKVEAYAGWYTTLKPAYEPIVVARKPFAGPVYKNVQQHGTGAMNIDACRVPAPGEKITTHAHREHGEGADDPTFSTYAAQETHQKEGQKKGRFPSNLVLTHHPGCGDECAEGCLLPALDKQAGMVTTSRGTRSGRMAGKVSGVYGKYDGHSSAGEPCGYNDTGGVSRYFPSCWWEPEDFLPLHYSTKTSVKEREAGCEHLAKKYGRKRGNNHVSVKPIKLIEWLIRLVTPTGGVVLDPFLGSGTTAVAASREGVSCIGIEQNEEYLEIARARVKEG